MLGHDNFKLPALSEIARRKRLHSACEGQLGRIVLLAQVRISDYTAFFLLGDLVEYDGTEKMFEQPQDKRTEDYITGRFG